MPAQALILAHQGEVEEASASVDEMLEQIGAKSAAAASAASSSAAPPPSARPSPLELECRILRAVLHVAVFEVDEAIEVAKTIQPWLVAGAPLRGRRSPSAPATWHGLLAQLALALDDSGAAARLLAEAQTAEGAPELGGNVPLVLWCRLLGHMLSADGAWRLERIRELGADEAIRPFSQLRSAATLAHGAAALPLGRREESEKLLARCVRHTVGQNRCDGLTASALLLLTRAVSQSDDGPAAETLAAAVAAAGGGGAEGGGGDEAGVGGALNKRRRTEDALSSALIIAARTGDEPAKRRALRGWASHHAALGTGTCMLEHAGACASACSKDGRATRNGAHRLPACTLCSVHF